MIPMPEQCLVGSYDVHKRIAERCRLVGREGGIFLSSLSPSSLSAVSAYGIELFKYAKPPNLIFFCGRVGKAPPAVEGREVLRFGCNAHVKYYLTESYAAHNEKLIY